MQSAHLDQSRDRKGAGQLHPSSAHDSERVISKQFHEGQQGIPSTEELTELGNRLSYASRRAESAENELKTVKVLELLTKHIGETFEGVVTGVTNFGLFIQHPKYLIDGLLRLENLGDDWWEVDPRVGRVVGERTRQTFTMGTLLTVSIVEVDVSARQMSLALVRTQKSSGGSGSSGRSRSFQKSGRSKGPYTKDKWAGRNRGRGGRKRR